MTNSPVLKYGFILGMTITVLHLISYLIDPTYLFSILQKILVGTLPAIVILHYALKQKRSLHEGSLTFSEAFQTSLFTYILGTFIGALFYFILINFIDPDLVSIGRETLADTSLKMIEKLGGEVRNTEEFRELLTEKFNPFSLSMTMLDWLGNLLFPGSVIALLLAVKGKS